MEQRILSYEVDPCLDLASLEETINMFNPKPCLSTFDVQLTMEPSFNCSVFEIGCQCVYTDKNEIEIELCQQCEIEVHTESLRRVNKKVRQTFALLLETRISKSAVIFYFQNTSNWNHNWLQ